MAYPSFNTEKGILDNLERKERAVLQHREEKDQSFWYLPRRLEFHANQLVAAQIMNPHTDSSRLLVKYAVGNGKTLTAILVALGFTRQMRAIESESRVFFIGYTESIIKEELLSHPELGFMSHAERLELRNLRSAAEAGNQVASDRHVALLNRIRQRITNPKKGGYFQFYGYLQLASLLFGIQGNADRIDVAAELQAGTLQVNQQLLERFRGSLIVCDEVHEIYNTVEFNNAGLAIKYILSTHGNKVRALFLSATPINNSPAEVVELANLLRHEGETELSRGDLFTADAHPRLLDRTATGEPALSRIGPLFRGRVLFLEDSGSRYPELIYEGKAVPGLDLLRFDGVEMSPLHARTYRGSQAHAQGTLESDERVLLDMVFPNPAFSAAQLADPKSGAVGLHRTADILEMATRAPETWRKEVGIEFLPVSGARPGHFAGPWLHRSRIGIYSAKYLALVKLVRRLVKREVGKIFIWHEKVRFGALMIQQLLLENGFLDETSEANDRTLCTRCGKSQRKCACERFAPARVLTIFGGLSPRYIEQMVSEYSSPSNSMGEQFRIIVGSSKVRQSFNFKATRFVIAASVPVNLATYVQFNGRAYRRDAMALLPPQLRQLRVHTFLTLGGIEQLRYQQKIEDHKEIMRIEREIHKEALNNYVNDIALADSRTRRDPLSSLPFAPLYRLPRPPFSRRTFRAYAHYEQEVATITGIIKRLFLSISVWRVDDLWRAVCDPPFAVERRTQLFDRENFNIALRNLLHYADADLVRLALGDSSDPLRTFEDPANKLFTFEQRGTRRATRKVLAVVGNFIVLAPFGIAPNLEVDCFLSPTTDVPFVGVKVTSGTERRYASQLASLSSADPYAALLEHPLSFHEYAIRRFLEGKHKMSKAFQTLYRALRLLSPEGESPEFYVSGNRFVKTASGWLEQPQPEDSRPENDRVVGFIEDKRLKLRRPMHVIRRELESNPHVDMRTVERGIKCESLRKEQLASYAKALELKKTESSRAFCHEALKRLIELDFTDPDRRWFYITRRA